VDGISFSDGRPVDNSLLGTFILRVRYWIIVGVVEATNSLIVLRLNTYGPTEYPAATGFLWEMGTRHGVKRPYYATSGTWSGSGSDFKSLLTTDGVVMSSGGTSFRSSMKRISMGPMELLLLVAQCLCREAWDALLK
jgi:hypothetical protein